MKEITLYHDGKGCRGKPATLLKEDSQRVLIRFMYEEYDSETDTWLDVEKKKWFPRVRRCDGGAYELWNLWYYKRGMKYDGRRLP